MQLISEKQIVFRNFFNTFIYVVVENDTKVNRRKYPLDYTEINFGKWQGIRNFLCQIRSETTNKKPFAACLAKRWKTHLVVIRNKQQLRTFQCRLTIRDSNISHCVLLYICNNFK